MTTDFDLTELELDPPPRVCLPSDKPYTIRPHFKSLLPKLRDEERAYLKQSIQEEGCREALIVWRETGELVDGHNRDEICTELGVPFKVSFKSFPDFEAVVAWIEDNQASRRNVTPQWYAYYMGEKYNRRKARGFKDGGGQTSEKMGAEHGVGESTVRRNEKFAQAVNTIADNCGTELKRQILDGDLDITKKDVEFIAKQPAADQKQIIRKLQRQEAKTPVQASQQLRQEQNKQLIYDSRRARSSGARRLLQPYPTLLARVPWDPAEVGDLDTGPEGEHEPSHRVMTLEELTGYKIEGRFVPDVAEADAHLYIQTPAKGAIPEMAYELCRIWGFEPQELITWVTDTGSGPRLKRCSEHFLFCTRGTRRTLDNRNKSWFNAPRPGNGLLPDDLYHLIERLSDGPWLEIFASPHGHDRDGWLHLR